MAHTAFSVQLLCICVVLLRSALLCSAAPGWLELSVKQSLEPNKTITCKATQTKKQIGEELVENDKKCTNKQNAPLRNKLISVYDRKSVVKHVFHDIHTYIYVALFCVFVGEACRMPLVRLGTSYNRFDYMDCPSDFVTARLSSSLSRLTSRFHSLSLSLARSRALARSLYPSRSLACSFSSIRRHITEGLLQCASLVIFNFNIL